MAKLLGKIFYPQISVGATGRSPAWSRPTGPIPPYCGVPELNSFLKATARQHSDKGISRTFVLSDPERPATIFGYFTLTLCEIIMDHLPSAYAKKYPHHGLPAIRLARLVVSKKYQGKGCGGLLLAEAIHRTVLIAEQAGLIGLFADAKDERAHKFYENGQVAKRESSSP